LELLLLLLLLLFLREDAIMGSETSETGNITQGRNQGIIFCSEKPKECAVEYSYLKLKETQK
jgi:hypothetical protein